VTADLSSWIAKAREVITRATPGRVEADRFGVIRGGPLNEYVNGSGRSGLVMVSITILSDDDTSEEVILRRDADTARVAIALNSLPALLDVAEAAAKAQYSVTLAQEREARLALAAALARLAQEGAK
jgi:hypothetical protein